jgi:uncharacterized membrane protein YbhN (UPF0104 family)
MASISCVSLIIVLYPAVPIGSSPEIEQVLHLSYVLLSASLLVLVAMAFGLRSRLLSAILNRLESYSSRLHKRLASRFGLERNEEEAGLQIRTLLQPWTAPKRLAPALILSLSIQVVAAVRGQIFFRSLGYPIPLSVNLFAAPVLFFVFMLPISFGSLGIREGAFILLYGLFGVPAETALLVSFFNLSGLVLNNVIGAAILLASNIRWQDIAGTLPQRESTGGSGS